MRKAKLQMLTSRFEIVNMKEDETFGELGTKLSEIVISMQGIGEKVFEVRVVEKILRSLPPHFDPKIIVVEESNDVKLLDVDELVGSLITYKCRRFSPKDKRIARKTTKKEKEVVHEKSIDDESFDSKPITMLTRNFQKYLKNVKRTRRRSSEWQVKGDLKRIQEINPIETRNLISLNAISVRDMVTLGLTVET